MMPWTTVLFDDIDTDTVPDGTIATAANTGLEGLTNATGTAKWTTLANGRRCITGMDGSDVPFDSSKITVEVVAAATLNAASIWGAEILMEYAGESPDTTQKTFLEVNNGGERLLVYHRTNSAWLQNIQMTVVDIGTLDDTPGNYINPTDGDQIEPGKRNWVGTYWKEDATEGMMGATLNGYPVHHYGYFDTTVMTDTSGLNRFTPMDGPNMNYRIYGFRYFTSGDIADHITPVYEDETENAVRIGKQYIEEIGPYSTDAGPGTISYETDSVGVISKVWHAVSGGAGSVTLGLRSGHAPGALRSRKGRACYGYTLFQPAANTVMDIRLTQDSTGDIGQLTWRGDLGTAGARPLYLDGVDTGVTGDETHSYIPVFVFDEQTNMSLIVWLNMTESSTTLQHAFPIDWDREGGIPSINDFIITMYGPGCRIGMPFDVPLADFPGPSSWSATPRTVGGATHNIPNHITAALDAYPNHGYFAKGMMGFTTIGRTGQLAAYIKAWWGNYANMGRMRHLRMLDVDNSINDLNNGLSVATILSNFQERVDMAVLNNIRIAVCSNVLLPAGGSHAWDDDFRSDQAAVNAGKLEILTAANRPDLMQYAPVQESFANQSEMDALFNIPVDDTHPTASAKFTIANLFVSLLGAVAASLRLRSRDRTTDRSFR